MPAFFLVLLFLPFLFSCKGGIYFQSLKEGLPSSQSSFSGEWEREEFVLNENKSLVDILIVVDTSPSMYHHLSDFGQSLLDLLSVISDYDWQIGITSADHGDHTNTRGLQQSWRDNVSASYGKFGSLMDLEDETGNLGIKILTPKVSNYKNVFFHTLSHNPHIDCQRPPYCHSYLEQPLRSLKAAMQRALVDNDSFFRPRADLVSLIITNEEERAEDRRRASEAKQIVQTFDDTFGHLDKQFIAFNILVKDEVCRESESAKSELTSISIGRSIMELAELTGGDNISICSRNYGQALRAVSKHIKNSLENSILLKKNPVPETVSIEFYGRELGWELYGRKIIFDRKKFSSETYVSVSYQGFD